MLFTLILITNFPFFLVPTVCTLLHLLDWHIPLFVMGAIFLVIGGVIGIFVIIDICKSELGQSYFIQYNLPFSDSLNIW